MSKPEVETRTASGASVQPFSRLYLAVVLTVWCLILAAAAFYAPKLPGVLRAADAASPGSESTAARELLTKEVRGGDIQDLVVVLTSEKSVEDPAYGDAAESLRQQIQQIDSIRNVSSYWASGEKSLVGKDGRTALLLVEAATTADEAQARIVPALRDATAELESAGVEAHVTGWAAVQTDLFDEAMGGARRSEKLAIPVVLVVLLLIFGSVVAGLLPLGLGIVSVGTTMAIFYFYAQYLPIDSTAPVVISMLGMGVGVDYSLLLVSRFREELARGLDRAAAVRRTVATAGKAVIFSGSTVVISVASLWVINNPVFRSITAAMVLVVIISVLAAVSLLPVVLYLLGPRVDALRLPRLGRPEANSAGGFWHRWSLRVMERPWRFALAAGLPLLLLALPAWRMETGWPNVSLLTPQADSRQGFELLRKQFDAGMMEPLELVVQVKDGAVTDGTNLPKLYELAEQVKQDPGVASVVSLVSLKPEWDLSHYREIYLEKPAELASLPSSLGEQSQQLDQLITGLRDLRTGLSQMAGKMPALGNGMAAGAGGIEEIRAGLGQTEQGLTAMAGQLEQGSSRVADMSDALDSVNGILTQAIADLDGMQPLSKADPRYPAVYQGVATARAMVAGVQGQPGLAAGLRQTADSLRTAGAGLRQIASGVASARQGLARVSGGLSQGPTGIQEASRGVDQMGSGIDQMIAELEKAQADLRKANEEAGSLNLQPVVSRGDFGLRLVAASGGKEAAELLPQLANVDRGADVARLIVVPKSGTDSSETGNLVHRLRETTLPPLAKDLGTVLVGGGPAQQTDLNDQLTDALPKVIALVLTVTFLVLMGMLRSVLLPLKAIIMNSLSVLAAYGLLVLVFQHGYLTHFLGFTPLGYVGSPSVVILFAVLFGLSMDYEVFMLSRVKEAYHETGHNEEAVAIGLEQTARIITGSALIMVAVFGAFLVNGMITIKELGLGLAVAVFLDATLIRTILVPAFMRLMGDWNWWAPRWLLRILPNLDIRHD